MKTWFNIHDEILIYNIINGLIIHNNYVPMYYFILQPMIFYKIFEYNYFIKKIMV